MVLKASDRWYNNEHPPKDSEIFTSRTKNVAYRIM